MLPANLAKTRAAGRSTYGELLMLNPNGGGPVTGGGTSVSAYRYAPYPLPVGAAAAAAAAAVAAGSTMPMVSSSTTATAAMLPIAVSAGPTLHYASAAAGTTPHATALYDVTGAVQAAAAASACKRVFAAALRPISFPAARQAHAAAAAAAAASTPLTYSMSDLLSVQSLDLAAVYPGAAAAAAAAAALGL